MPGPAPKKNARRRNIGPSAVTLPAEGRRGRPPAFPLPAFSCWDQVEEKAVRVRELALWRQLWCTPQAVAWERLRMHTEVGLYCRLRAQAERGDVKAASESRLMGDRLGMTPMSMLRLRWEISTDELATPRAERAAAKKAAAKSTARRLRAVD